MRILVSAIDQAKAPQRAATMEITASRKAPKDQSAKIIYDGKGKPGGARTHDGHFGAQRVGRQGAQASQVCQPVVVGERKVGTENGDGFRGRHGQVRTGIAATRRRCPTS